MDGTFERMKSPRSHCLISKIKFATRLRRSSWRRRQARGRVQIVTRDVPVYLQVVSTHWILFIEYPGCASFNYAFSLNPRYLYTEKEMKLLQNLSISVQCIIWHLLCSMTLTHLLCHLSKIMDNLMHALLKCKII